MGIAMRKENCVAPSLDIPRNKPAVIVIPDLETPGARASVSAIPIKRASFILLSSRFLFPSCLLSM